MTTVLRGFRIVDEMSDFYGSVMVEDGIIAEVHREETAAPPGADFRPADTIIGGSGLVLMPAFVDLHAHFREPPFTGKETPLPEETLESACLAAAAGGYGTAACMANTRPPTDGIGQALALKRRADASGIIDVFPVLSLTKSMEGKELSEISKLAEAGKDALNAVRLLSEDGRDVGCDDLFLAALEAAAAAGVPVSCHCDLGGEDAATERAIALARHAAETKRIGGAVRLHIAHVSTAAALESIRAAKANLSAQADPDARAAGLSLTCEVTPHHIALTSDDAARLGVETFGKVAPPLRAKKDRLALAAALAGGTIDAVATDHAPHTETGKQNGDPGFSGLETAFAVCYTALTADAAYPAAGPRLSLSRLSSLMSASPARILGLGGTGGKTARNPEAAPPRGIIAPGYKADFCAARLNREWTVETAVFRSRGKNSPFAGKTMRGKIVLTIHNGKIVYDGRES